MASPTQWTWAWASSGSWWWTRKPGMLRFIGVTKTWTQLSDWTELNACPGPTVYTKIAIPPPFLFIVIIHLLVTLRARTVPNHSCWALYPRSQRKRAAQQRFTKWMKGISQEGQPLDMQQAPVLEQEVRLGPLEWVGPGLCLSPGPWMCKVNSGRGHMWMCNASLFFQEKLLRFLCFASSLSLCFSLTYGCPRVQA